MRSQVALLFLLILLMAGCTSLVSEGPSDEGNDPGAPAWDPTRYGACPDSSPTAAAWTLPGTFDTMGPQENSDWVFHDLTAPPGLVYRIDAWAPYNLTSLTWHLPPTGENALARQFTLVGTGAIEARLDSAMQKDEARTAFHAFLDATGTAVDDREGLWERFWASGSQRSFIDEGWRQHNVAIPPSLDPIPSSLLPSEPPGSMTGAHGKKTLQLDDGYWKSEWSMDERLLSLYDDERGQSDIRVDAMDRVVFRDISKTGLTEADWAAWMEGRLEEVDLPRPQREEIRYPGPLCEAVDRTRYGNCESTPDTVRWIDPGIYEAMVDVENESWRFFQFPPQPGFPLDPETEAAWSPYRLVTLSWRMDTPHPKAIHRDFTFNGPELRASLERNFNETEIREAFFELMDQVLDADHDPETLWDRFRDSREPGIGFITPSGWARPYDYRLEFDHAPWRPLPADLLPPGPPEREPEDASPGTGFTSNEQEWHMVWKAHARQLTLHGPDAVFAHLNADAADHVQFKTTRHAPTLPEEQWIEWMEEQLKAAGLPLPAREDLRYPPPGC